MSISKIERLKKKFWKKYTKEYTIYQEAFEIMRLIGIEQGEWLEKIKQKKESLSKKK